MDEITRLLAAGYGISFEPWLDGRTECTLMTPAGDVTIALGRTPAAALAEASPLTQMPLPTIWTMLDRISDLESWAEGVKERLEKLEAA